MMAEQRTWYTIKFTAIYVAAFNLCPTKNTVNVTRVATSRLFAFYLNQLTYSNQSNTIGSHR